MNALEIRNLTKDYGEFTLDNLNLTLPCGCIMGLIGENGAGKSTTIKLILDMIHRDEGTITLLGRDNREDMDKVAECIALAVHDFENSEEKIRAMVTEICKKYPLYE